MEIKSKFEIGKRITFITSKYMVIPCIKCDTPEKRLKYQTKEGCPICGNQQEVGIPVKKWYVKDEDSFVIKNIIISDKNKIYYEDAFEPYTNYRVEENICFENKDIAIKECQKRNKYEINKYKKEIFNGRINNIKRTIRYCKIGCRPKEVIDKWKNLLKKEYIRFKTENIEKYFFTDDKI